MFRKIAAFEFRYQVRQPVFWVVAILFGLTAYFTIAASNVIVLGFGASINRNSPFALAETHFLFGVLYMFVTTAFVANTIARDDDTGFGALIRTSRISKFDYLYGRFVGAFGAVCLSFAAVPLGLLIATLMPWVDPETLGPFRIQDYLYAYAIVGLPPLLVTSSIFFALSTVTRSMMWSYVGVVGFLVVYFARGMVLGDASLREIAALSDPFGGAAFEQVTRYWTVAEKNLANPPLEGVLLWNKVIWTAVSAIALVSAYGLFRFATGQPRGKRKRAVQLAAQASPEAPPPAAELALAKPSFGVSTSLVQLWARTRLDMGQVFLSPAYFVLLMVGAAFAVFALWTVTDLQAYGGSVLPVTRVMIDRLNSSFTVIPLIIAIYYAGELVWREREKNVSELLDASATLGWVFSLPKILAITLVLLSTLLIGVVIAVLIQTARGYHDYQFDKYLLWLVLPQTVDFALLAVLAIFVQAFSPNKFVGWAIMVAYLILQGTLASFGYEHNLYNYGSTPPAPLSDLNGQGKFWIGAWWLRLYWGLLAVALAVLTHAMWQRGVDSRMGPRLKRLPGQLKGAPGWILAVALIGFAASGAFIYVNTNVWNEYRTREGNERWQGDFEKELLKFERVPQPKITDVRLDVAVYPDEPRVTTRGAFVMENRTAEPLREVHVLFDRDLKVLGLSIEGARPKTTYPRFNYRVFAFDTPMQPGERRSMSFITEFKQKGFRNSGNIYRVVQNGTFVNNVEIAPELGFTRRGLLQDRAKRRKQGLASELKMAPLGDSWSRQFNYIRHDSDFVHADITVSTVAGQTPIAPGYKVSDVTRDGRRTARFVTEAPILHLFSIQSARYAVKTDRYKGIDLAVYYDARHPWNIDRMIASMKLSLDYFQSNFSPYQFRQVRYLEFPDYAQFAQSFANTIPWSEGLGFIASYKDPSKIDLVTYIGAHEVAHQWWAHQIIGADQQGRTALSETLAQYSALMVMKHHYGEDMIRKFLKFELDSYLRNRGGQVLEEQPLAKVEDQDYIHYRKGSLVMYRLAEEMGEDAVNRALRRLLQQYAFKGAPYPTSLDLISALRAEAPADKQQLITDLFEKITLYDIKTTGLTSKKRADGKYDVTLTVEARKLYADGKGKETEAPMTEMLDVGVFSEMPGDKKFKPANVIAFEKRPIRSGRQTITLVTATAPKFGGVDPYNKLIDRNSDDNVARPG